MSEESESLAQNIDLHFLEDIDIDEIVKYLNDTENVLYDKREAEILEDEKSKIIQEVNESEKKVKNNDDTKEISNTVKTKNERDDDWVSNEYIDKFVQDEHATNIIGKPSTNLNNAKIELINQNHSKTNINLSSVFENSSSSIKKYLHSCEQDKNTQIFLKKEANDTPNKINKISSLKQECINNVLDTPEKEVNKNASDTTTKITNIKTAQYNMEKTTSTQHKKDNTKDEIYESTEISNHMIKSNKIGANITNKLKQTLDLTPSEETLNKQSEKSQKVCTHSFEIIDDSIKSNDKIVKDGIKGSNHFLNYTPSKGVSIEKPVMLQEVSKRFIEIDQIEKNATKKVKHSIPSQTEKYLKKKGIMSQKVSNYKRKVKKQFNDSKIKTINPSANSVVLRKDDLQFLEKLEKKLYDFLCVKFTDLSVIHYGKYSKILKCKQKEQTYAVKIVNENLSMKNFGSDKEKMLIKLRSVPKHKLFYINLLASFALEKNWCFLFDYYPKNLREELNINGPMHIDVVQNLSRQLLAALNALRNQKLIHSNIKPEHILLNHSNNMLKLCGFDTSYYIAQVNMLPNIGTASYRAPEVIIGYSAGFSIDIWSTSLVIYEMITNQKLFSGYFNNDILYKQMCILGNMPINMINNSIYGRNHFLGGKFLKREGYNGQDTRVIYGFNKNSIFKRMPYITHNKCWGRSSNEMQRNKDRTKISLLISLLDKMLVLYPLDRIAIEFVGNHKFMYQNN